MGLQWVRRGLLLALSVGTGVAAPSLTSEATAQVTGRVLVLPGIYNTRFHLHGFVKAVQAALPAGFSVEVRPWGAPFLGLYNLLAEDQNAAAVRALADELAAWRREHPRVPLYLVGYSGGGGIATLVAAALPDDVTVDRLILVAPAIAPDFPMDSAVLPKVDEFVVNFASARDLQVGWGTRVFGTIDREKTDSAGAIGFSDSDARLIEWHWTPSARQLGHRGNHLGYLGHRWQAAVLLPALDPAVTATALRERFVMLMDQPELEREVSP